MLKNTFAFSTLLSKYNNFSSGILPQDSSSTSNMIDVRSALNKALDEEMARDEKVIIIGEEVAQYNGAYKISKGLLDKYGGKRVMDTPISEYGFAGMGVGAAFTGLRPVVEFMSMNFSLQAIDHIVNSAAKGLYMSGGQLKCPIVFRGPNGPSVAVAAQHSQDFAPWYSSVPGLKVLAPWSAEDAYGLMKAAIRDDNPVVFLESELLYGKKFPMDPSIWNNPNFTIPIGKAKIERPGKHVTIVSYSQGLNAVMDASKILSEKHGIEAEVINLRSIRPLDTETIFKSLAKTHHLVTSTEDWPQCGIGAEIAARIAESKAFFDLDAPIERLTCADVPIAYAENLEKLSLPDAKLVVSAVLRSLNKKQ